jgi:hypothetical protein
MEVADLVQRVRLSAQIASCSARLQRLNACIDAMIVLLWRAKMMLDTIGPLLPPLMLQSTPVRPIESRGDDPWELVRQNLDSLQQRLERLGSLVHDSSAAVHILTCLPLGRLLSVCDRTAALVTAVDELCRATDLAEDQMAELERLVVGVQEQIRDLPTD